MIEQSEVLISIKAKTFLSSCLKVSISLSYLLSHHKTRQQAVLYIQTTQVIDQLIDLITYEKPLSYTANDEKFNLAHA